MSDRKHLLDAVKKLEDFVKTKGQALTTSVTSPPLSTRKRNRETSDTSPTKRLRTSIGLADTVEDKTQQAAPDAPQSAPSRKRPTEADDPSAAKRLRVSLESEITDEHQAAQDASPASPQTAQSRKRRAEADQTPPVKRLRKSFDFKDRTERLLHLARQNTRVGRYLRLLACQGSSEAHWTELNAAFSEGHIPLALAFIDLAENIRLKALRSLGAASRFELFEYISEIQMNKDKFDPKSLYPCVATKKFMDTLPFPAHNCSICGRVFEDGYDVIWKGCGKHTFHYTCFKLSITQNQRPLCDCL